MNWRDSFGFYRHRTNWHKHPLVTKFLCWMGRHDYEPAKVIASDRVLLECFYCLQRKDSTFHRD